MYRPPVIPSKFKALLSFGWLCIAASLCFFGNYGAAWAQLPPTNMGKFVHQPGDNQYTTQTQSERHGVALSAPAAPIAPVSNTIPATTPEYKPTPATPKPDISLLPIVADEPIKPAGFPPLPDRLDLPNNGSLIWSGNSANGNGGSLLTLSRGINSAPTGIHQHYVHYEAGAFIPKEDLRQTVYRPAATDYYNVNPAARPAVNLDSGTATAAGASAGNIETPATQALRKFGPEPQLAADAVSKPEVPSAVTVNQSVSQDLSLPEDEFNKHYPTPIANSTGNRVSRGLGHVLVYPLRNLGYSAASMAAGAASSASMYGGHW